MGHRSKGVKSRAVVPSFWQAGWTKMKKNKKQWIFIFSVTIIFLFLHAFIDTDFGDDLAYAERFSDNLNLTEFLINQYYYWASRLIIQAVNIPMVLADPWLWKILDTLVTVIFIVNVSDMFGVGNEDGRLKSGIIFFFLIWLVPMESLYSAGWITTSMNYLWTLSFGSVALRPLMHLIKNEKCSTWENIVCPLCALYSANIEQTASILLGSYIVVGAYAVIVKKRKLSVICIVQLVIISALVVFSLTAPGNAVRNAAETERCFPEFAGLGTMDKLCMGFIESAHYYLAAGHMQVCFIFAALSGILFLMAPKKWYKKLTAFFPFAFYWFFGHIGKFLLYGGFMTRGLNIVGVLGENRQLPGLGMYDNAQVAFQVITYMAVFACVAVTIYFIHGKTEETGLEMIILAAGFASRVIMGFSPTLYASGDRTALFSSAAILIVTMRNMKFWLDKKPKLYMKMISCGYIFLLICLSLNIKK